jgi:hypothetical protein
MKIQIKPKIQPNQHIVLLLDEYPLPTDRPSRSYYFEISAPKTPQEFIDIPTDNIEAGRYLARLQIDGVNSGVIYPQKSGEGEHRPVIPIDALEPPAEQVVLRSTGIVLEIQSQTTSEVTISGKVSVKNNKNAIVPDAAVQITWTSPDQTTISQTSKTNNDGIAIFTISGVNGRYQLDVQNIQSTGAEKFDRSNSQLTESIDTSFQLICARRINLEFTGAEGGSIYITGTVRVEDENGNRVDDAEVRAQWTLPNNSKQPVISPTNHEGIAEFTISDRSGFYELTVLDVRKTNYQFDRDNSQLSKRIEILTKQLRCTSIELSYQGDGTVIIVAGKVEVKDDSGAVVQGATVAVDWALADGSTLHQAADTGQNGVADFSVSDGRGSYTLSIAKIKRADGVYDEQNSIHVKKIEIPNLTFSATNIELSAEETNDVVTVSGKIYIKDQAGVAVSGATVSTRWELPDGTTQSQTPNTDSGGVASFKVTNQRGGYALTVLDITKAGYIFDPDHSMLKKNIVSPNKRLLSRNIDLAVQESGNNVTVNAQVKIEDENGTSIKSAKVSIQWALPEGSSQNQTADTNSQGLANFSISNGRGNYKLTVIDVNKADFIFDPENSLLSKSIV